MRPPRTIADLRRMAVAASLRAPTTLTRAIKTLGFIQADPIRAPARAQDLILRHRVADYRVGDLQRRFEKLRLEEDFFYAYGIMPHATWQVLHPRHDPDVANGRHAPDTLAADVLAFVRERGVVHPRDLEATFGRERALNGWGSWSKATTRALHRLQYYGLLRVARRQDGIRIYAPALPHADPLSAAERTHYLILLLTRILAPLPERSLRPIAPLLTRGAPDLTDPLDAAGSLLASGELEVADVEGERYLWPSGLRAPEPPRVVRLLAPFDPVVWNRKRIEMLWDWDYRFEAYTPEADRRFGYYAMPLLWGEDLVGWANVVTPPGRIDVRLGFIGARPRGAEFRAALDAEITRLEEFLGSR